MGAGGFGRETAEMVRAINDAGGTWRLKGFVDDAHERLGPEVGGIPVLGPVAAVETHPDAQIVVSVGSPDRFHVGKEIVTRLGLGDERYATLVHPMASVGSSVAIGRGTVVLAGAVATADVRVGRHVRVMPNVVLTHDVVVGDHVSFGAGAYVAGRVAIEEGAYVGSGSAIREGRSVGRWSQVGMGAVVTRDVPAGEVWVGTPARRLRDVVLPKGWR